MCRLSRSSRALAVPMAILLWITAGCAALFGWNIHAPGVLSAQYYQQVEPYPSRVTLYFPKELLDDTFKNRGSRFADPQVYYAGEALGPILIEAFQHGFQEFFFMEVEPDPAILQQYGIEYLVTVKIRNFGNRVTLKGQQLMLELEAGLYDAQMQPLMRFVSKGTSEAFGVFAKKGGPEVNLNAAIENATRSMLYYLHDAMRQKLWNQASS